MEISLEGPLMDFLVKLVNPANPMLFILKCTSASARVYYRIALGE